MFTLLFQYLTQLICLKQKIPSLRMVQQIYTNTKFYGSPQKITFEGETKFSVPDIDTDHTEAEWKIFRRILLTNFRESSVSSVLTSLLQNDTLKANLERLASIALVLPVTTATVQLWKEALVL